MKRLLLIVLIAMNGIHGCSFDWDWLVELFHRNNEIENEDRYEQCDLPDQAAHIAMLQKLDEEVKQLWNSCNSLNLGATKEKLIQLYERNEEFLSPEEKARIFPFLEVSRHPITECGFNLQE